MRKHWKIILLVLFVALALTLLSVYFIFRQRLNTRTNKLGENTLIEIVPNKSALQVGEDLASLYLINDAKVFYYYERFSGHSVVPGFYEIAPNMSTKEIADLLNSGKTKVVKLTIPEGYRLEQIAVKIAAAGITSYADFVAAAKGYEGKLFPDTFNFNPRMKGSEIVKMMNDDYQRRTAGLNVTNDNLIISSIVEKEAANDDDRATIAGIYLNRVKAGMRLQSDPTVAYGRDSINISSLTPSAQQEYIFWKSAKTVEFSSVKSSYNTYQVDGLPAGPICNPGLASIQAVLTPASTPYYYFLYGRDGKLHTAKTQAEHNLNVANYL